MSLELKLNHHYHGFTLDVALQLADDGVTALFGPSGCGKSTLLRLLAGVELARSGTIRFANECWQDSDAGHFIPARQRNIGMVFQDARLFPHLSVLDNLRFASRYLRTGVNLSETELIDRLQLAPLLSQKPGTLSGGQQQRVALARALLSRPRLLLLDEPLSALDQVSRQLLLELIEELQYHYHLPMIYVTHSADEVLRLANHMVQLEAGSVIAQGDPAHLFGRPESDPLLGERALLRGRVVQKDSTDEMSAIQCIPEWPPIWIAGTDYPLGTRVTLSIQARDIALSLQPISGTSVQNQLPVTIDMINPDHSGSPMISLRYGNCRLPARVSRRALTQLKLHTDMTLWALIKSVAVEKP